jgi:hypothetical protein
MIYDLIFEKEKNYQKFSRSPDIALGIFLFKVMDKIQFYQLNDSAPQYNILNMQPPEEIKTNILTIIIRIWNTESADDRPPSKI